MINEMLKRAIRRASNMPTSKLFLLIQNVAEVSNAEPRTCKTFTNRSKGVLKGKFISFVKRTIDTKEI
jgi:hypothetical protein